MATYSNAEVEPLAQRLVQQLPGLDIRLARVWIRSESGGNNNPLGVTAARGSSAPVGQWISADRYLIAYPTRTAGIDAAAALIRRSPNYAGIRASLGGTLASQAQAVIASPWHARNSPYYTRVFTQAGLLASRAIAPGPIPATLATSGTVKVSTLLGLPDDLPITPGNLPRIRDAISAATASGKITAAIAQQLLQAIGSRGVAGSHGNISTLGSLSINPATGNVPAPAPLEAITDTFGAIFDPENWAYAGALVIGVPLALLGFYLLAGVPTGGRNA